MASKGQKYKQCSSDTKEIIKKEDHISILSFPHAPIIFIMEI